MLDLTDGPIPDWGLHCRHCGAPLAGLRRQCCASCGRMFSLLALLAAHRPIPDLGLTCPTCGYSLTGLLDDRCPECGDPFLLAELLDAAYAVDPPATLPLAVSDPSDHHLKRRKPTFTGRERPLPDFSLRCERCDTDLVGAKGDMCPSCGERFDLEALVPRGDWVDISRFIPRRLGTTIRSLLYDAQVPYLVQVGWMQELYGVHQSGSWLIVPREFFF